MGKKKKKKSVKVEEKNDRSEAYSSFDEYLDFDVAVSTLQDCCSRSCPRLGASWMKRALTNTHLGN